MHTRLKQLIVVFSLTMMQQLVYAQDTTRTITDMVTDEGEVWYMQPWVWIVGGIALLLILISLFSGGRKKTVNNNSTRTDKVIITKTVRRETDIDE